MPPIALRTGAPQSSPLIKEAATPRNQRPSFLKRQKEQKRLARAAEKRESRRLKRQAAAAEPEESAETDAEANELEGTEEGLPEDSNSGT